MLLYGNDRRQVSAGTSEGVGGSNREYRLRTTLHSQITITRRRLEGGGVPNSACGPETVTEGWLGFFLAAESLCFFFPISVQVQLVTPTALTQKTCTSLKSR